MLYPVRTTISQLTLFTFIEVCNSQSIVVWIPRFFSALVHSANMLLLRVQFALLHILLSLKSSPWFNIRKLLIFGFSYDSAYSFFNISFRSVCRMRINPENGLLYLLLVKSTHLFKAYKKTKEIVVSKKGFVMTLSCFHEAL